ncbi:MAG TPA: tyrosine-type recombinase/integrase, partial [Roseiarcus sp.]|nr:tyrosine-type recombinase/integrase [Roseiarcus sp.]
MKTELKSAHLVQAIAWAEEGVEAEKRIRDTIVPGLCIRIRGRSAAWHLMTRTQSIRLAAVDELSVKDARERARSVLQETKPKIKRAVAAMLEAGIPPVDANLIARGIPIDPTDKWVGTWTWSKGMGEFLVTKAEELSPNWFRQFRRFALDDVFFPLEARALAKLEFAHLDAIRQEVRTTYSATRASRVMSAAIDMLDWIWKEHRSEAGLQKLQYPWWRDLSLKQKTGRPRFVPSVDNLVRTISALEREPDLKSVHVKIVHFVVATAQRIDQVCSLKRSQVQNNPDRSAIVHWTAKDMKGRQPHAIWIPKEVARLIANEGNYAFPADQDGRRPVRPSVINRWLGNLWGTTSTKPKVERKGRPGPKPGYRALPPVLKEAGIPYWTPHAVRSVFATVLIDAMQDAAASAILAHKRPKSVPLPERPADTARAEDVTLRFYSRSQRLPLKQAGME